MTRRCAGGASAITRNSSPNQDHRQRAKSYNIYLQWHKGRRFSTGWWRSSRSFAQVVQKTQDDLLISASPLEQSVKQYGFKASSQNNKKNLPLNVMFTLAANLSIAHKAVW